MDLHSIQIAPKWWRERIPLYIVNFLESTQCRRVLKTLEGRIHLRWVTGNEEADEIAIMGFLMEASLLKDVVCPPLYDLLRKINTLYIDRLNKP